MLSAGVLAAYVAHGFRETADGEVELKCLPEHEAATFDAPGKPTFSMPATFGGHIAEALPRGRLERHAHVGHFGPLQAPRTVAASILEAASNPPAPRVTLAHSARPGPDPGRSLYRMTVPVPLEELRGELKRHGDAGYLLTVSPDGRPHCVAVALDWEGDLLRMGAGTTSVRNAAERRQVSLLSPPPAQDRDGYSLIVDADVVATSGTGGGDNSVTLKPTHAVLHRPAVAPDGSPAHDCVHVYDEAAEPHAHP